MKSFKYYLKIFLAFYSDDYLEYTILKDLLSLKIKHPWHTLLKYLKGFVKIFSISCKSETLQFSFLYPITRPLLLNLNSGRNSGS